MSKRTRPTSPNRASRTLIAFEQLEERDVPVAGIDLSVAAIVTPSTASTPLVTAVEPLDLAEAAPAAVVSTTDQLLGLVNFSIDSGASYISAAGNLLGFPIREQSPLSLASPIGGVLAVELSEGAFTLVAGTQLDPIASPELFLPGNLPADFAGFVEVGSIRALGAFRNLLLGGASTAITVAADGSFSAEGMTFEITNGSFSYDFLGLTGTTALDGQSGVNAATAAGQITQLSNQIQLTIPIDVSVSFVEESLGVSLTIDLTGQIVGYADLPSPPNVQISGPSVLARGEPGLFTLTAEVGPNEDPSQDFTFAIDWDYDQIPDQFVVGPSGTQVVHVFPDEGFKGVLAVAVNSFGSVSQVAGTGVFVVPYRVSTVDGVTDFIYGGTPGDDYVLIFDGPTGEPNMIHFLELLLNNQVQENFFTAATSGRVIVYAQGGNDLIVASSLTRFPAWIYGGEGDDLLFGGDNDDLLWGDAGNDYIVGNAGSDGITGGEGNDILIGGAGLDFLIGGPGSNLVLTGSFSVASPTDAAFAVRAEWNSGRSFADRVDNLAGVGSGPRNNGDLFLTPGTTALDDSAIDLVLADQDEDWILANLEVDLLGGTTTLQVITDLDV